MNTRTMMADDGVSRLYHVFDAAGRHIGSDVEPIPTATDVNLATLQNRAVQALATNKTYLGIASPTNAQVAAQVTRLTRECSGVIRLLLGSVDDIAGT